MIIPRHHQSAETWIRTLLFVVVAAWMPCQLTARDFYGGQHAWQLSMIVLAGLAVAVAVVMLLGRLITLRVRAAVRRSADLNRMMTQALRMGKYYVLEYDCRSGRVRNAYGDLLPAEGLSDEELIDRIYPDQREDFRQKVDSMKRGECDAWTVAKRWNAGTLEAPDWREYDGSAILERENGRPRYIFHTFKDITHEVEEEMHNQALSDRYMMAFQTNMMAMSFYSADGKLIDLNGKMRELCEMDAEREHFFRTSSLFEDPFARSFLVHDSHETYHVCGRMYYPQLHIDKYIESRIEPVYDDSGHLVHYIVAARDVTGDREMYRRQLEHERQQEQTHEAISRYEQQLRYLLEESDMFVWKLDLQQRTMTYFRSLREALFSETLDECMERMTDDTRQEMEVLLRDNVLQGRSFTAYHHFTHTKFTKHPMWFFVSGMPIHDESGALTGFFGIVRDVTDLMEAQQKLREETARAEDSGRLKSAFLANMTHEIRTPLNAIVGFSDLLQVVDSQEDRKEFIRIIRNNCDMLLRLINDFLEASSMGQSLAIQAEQVDLARVFDDICQTLEQRVQKAGVTFLKENPYDSCPAVLDKGRLQQVLTNFVTNAVKYTHEGHIKVGYRKEQGGLYVYCEDTGAGIPEEKQAAVFERFVKLNDYVPGTGLGLSICKAIVERCHGRIGVTSAGEGHGSTFWFWVPI